MGKLSSAIKVLPYLFFMGVFLIAIFFAWQHFRPQEQTELIIGAGSTSGEAYQFVSAISEVTDAFYPDVKITVRATKGSSENVALLESGDIHLGTVQADIATGPSARLVASLYPDLFQLIARKDAAISSFADLKGKRVALPSEGGGQWVSFWFVANHYGIFKEDIIPVKLSSSEAIDALIAGEIDATFKVRAPRNKQILDAITRGNIVLVPIDQTEALRIKQPSITAGTIPKGAYNGADVIPSQDLETAVVERLLIAHEDVDPEAVKAITQILFERRLELLKTTPLAGFISQPNWSEGTFIPIHEGAVQFFEREKPSFFVENADFVALILSVGLMAISGLIGMRKKAAGDAKNIADEYTIELVSMMQTIHNDPNMDDAAVKAMKDRLFDMYGEAARKYDTDEIGKDGLSLFADTWGRVHNLLSKP